jgi:choline dehydrogenase
MFGNVPNNCNIKNVGCVCENDFEADFVIIGGGTSGCLLANRLSEDGKYSVILLEQGQNMDSDELILNPENSGGFSNMLNNHYARLFFQCTTFPENNVSNRTFPYTLGRLLGGGSSVNDMLYINGSNSLYEKWQQDTGDSRWSPVSVRNTFNELQTTGGMLIRKVPEVRVAVDLQTATIAITGTLPVDDYNNTEAGAFTQARLFQTLDSNGEPIRASSSHNFIENIIKKPSENRYIDVGIAPRRLRIFYETTVLKIKTKSPPVLATGVDVIQNNRKLSIGANQTVICCAGVNTPALLMNSGIGPVGALADAGVNVVFANEHVGVRLQNHPIMLSIASVPDSSEFEINLPKDLYSGGALLPDAIRNLSDGVHPSARSIELLNIGQRTPDGKKQVAIALFLLQPRSTGSVIIQSGDPLRIPKVGDEYLSDGGGGGSSPGNADDIDVLARGMFTVRDIINYMHDNIDTGYVRTYPPTDVPYQSMDNMRDYIRKNLEQSSHWSSTCRMAASPLDGACNSSGEVYGVQRLVVGDVCASPQIVDGHTSASAYLIAQKLATYLK